MMQSGRRAAAAHGGQVPLGDVAPQQRLGQQRRLAEDPLLDLPQDPRQQPDVLAIDIGAVIQVGQRGHHVLRTRDIAIGVPVPCIPSTTHP